MQLLFERAKRSDALETAETRAEVCNSRFIQALRQSGRKFEDAGRVALQAESARDRGMPPRPLDISVGSAGRLCADSPLSGF
jgi:hypothetical protein